MGNERTHLLKFLITVFWDCDFSTLRWDERRDFIIRRILQSGSWDAITWLRAELGDPELSHWIEQRHGAGLSPRQLRFWEVVLDLPHPKVTRWVQHITTHPWERRLNR
jgi:hypothetical protein